MKNAPIAYQIYSARKEAEQDLLSVLRQLKALGYDAERIVTEEQDISLQEEP